MRLVYKTNKYIYAAILSCSFSSFVIANDSGNETAMDKGAVCEGFGPQAPRDIDSVTGENKRLFSLAPSYSKMNLCNIHFHNNAEHKAKDFSIYAGEGNHGHGGGYQCSSSQSLSKKELQAPEGDVCNGLKPGDTIEVHWVHSSCDVKPGKGLGSCLSESCANPDLRVETQVFVVVNDPSALDFSDFAYDGNVVDGLHQAKALPVKTGKPVEFLGSTTGPKYTEQKCSPLQVSWSVRPQCAKININTLGKWCKGNVFKEDHAHGVRKLVTNPKLLSKIK
ncbi:delta-class carbonic anhydrase [Aliikangiella coralliicola]|uniref:Cadmium carbonic anhydrase n=1 Tax=Aliikangiella coralliicola TaxID=2592383 RepID=A0A545UCK1_9GAMM|nr:delta-class carbonic anhydrase [Aliikangiella coralliicola]TQV87195.1 cadmium carbonic anhydrase [Aliikangiella coralliicola]